MRERGTVIAYSHDVSAGVIGTPDGATFLFMKRAWFDPSEPKAGIEVQFREDGKNAQEVRPY